MKRSVLVPLFLVSALALWFVQRPSGDPEGQTVAVRELLTLSQAGSGASFTFDRTTARALEETRVPRPEEPLGTEALARALEKVGFELRPLGNSDRKVFQVRSRG